MVPYQNLTRKPELFRASWARAPLDPGPGTMYPLNPPLAGPAHGTVVEKLMVEELPELTELSLSQTVDVQKIENLLNEHSDSECECQNDNELWTLLNLKLTKSINFVVLYSLSLYV